MADETINSGSVLSPAERSAAGSWTPQTPTVNREYKDRLFKFVFGRNKAWLLDLYNALHRLDYSDPDVIEMTTMEDVLYLSMKNDISFRIGNVMNFYESQSTVTSNMPMRFQFYFDRLYSLSVKNDRNSDIYGSKLVRFPMARFICFYEGAQEIDDITHFRLNDAFAASYEGFVRDAEVSRSRQSGAALDPEARKVSDDIDRTEEQFYKESGGSAMVIMLNINRGHNTGLLNACKPLKEYSDLVCNIRELHKKASENSGKQGNIDNDEDKRMLSDAVRAAVEAMPDDALIKELLLNELKRVVDMCLTQYDEEKTMRLLKEEGREEGKKDGQNTILVLLKKLTEDGRLNEIDQVIASEEYRETLFKQYNIAH